MERSVQTPNTSSPCGYQVQYRSLRRSDHILAFPCDERGRVELDALSEPVRLNYLFARAMVGREMAPPAVVAVG